MRTVLVALATLAALLPTPAIGQERAPVTADLVGVWRLCHTPVPDGVLCLIQGYLMFLPDGRFVSIVDPPTVLGPKRVIGSGTYRIEGSSVLLQAETARTVDNQATGNQPSGIERFVWHESEDVEFKGDGAVNTRLPVLRPEHGVYCGYARVF